MLATHMRLPVDEMLARVPSREITERRALFELNGGRFDEMRPVYLIEPKGK